MAGPLPKEPNARRRRNAPTVARKAVPASGRRGRTPKPARELAKGSTAAEWWRNAWRLPVAVLWSGEDIPALTRLALMQAEYLDLGEAKHLGEIRALEDRFGLSLKSREALGIFLVDDVPAAPASAASSLPGTPGDLANRFDGLRVV